MPTTLAELTDDSTHRLATDAEKITWNGKQDAGDYATNTALNLKVDKIDGKGLSTNDLTDTLKSNYDTAYTNSHTHSNKTDLDQVNKNFTLTYNDGQLVQKTYSSSDYITFSYNLDGTIDQIKYYTNENVLYNTKTAQYSNDLFIGWA